MLPPFGAVVGGITMLALAVGAPDPLVVGDYARIEELTRAEFAADRRAAELDVRAAVTIMQEDEGRARITVELAGGPAFVSPLEIDVRLRHAARAAADRTVRLAREGGTYGGQTDLAAGRYTVELSPSDAAWRLAGDTVGHSASIELRPITAPGL
jgi:hypothetical protein